MTIHAGVPNKRGWVRIGKGMPPPFNLCPICQHDHWCMFQIDESAVICGRTDMGYDKDLGDAGFLFRLKRDQPGGRFNLPPMDWLEQRRAAKEAEQPGRNPAELAALSKEYEEALPLDALNMLARTLGVSGASLMLLGAGWAKKAFSFPMRRPDMTIVGIRLRTNEGKKYAVRGSRNRLFIPVARVGIEGPLVVCEGPTDTAAMMGLGYDAVGRPSCRGCHEDILQLANPTKGKAAKPRDVVILADDDGPGLSGAESLADYLIDHRVKSVKIVTPQGRKDAREWVNDGADRAAVDRAIANAWFHQPEVSA